MFIDFFRCFQNWSIRWIICTELIHPLIHLYRTGPQRNHFSRTGPSMKSFVQNWSIHEIICLELVHPRNHLYITGPSTESFVQNWSIMKSLFRTGPSTESFVQNWSIHGIICSELVHPIICTLQQWSSFSDIVLVIYFIRWHFREWGGYTDRICWLFYAYRLFTWILPETICLNATGNEKQQTVLVKTAIGIEQ